MTAHFLHQSLRLAGVPSGVQTLVILVADIGLIVLVLRLFGGVLRLLLVVFLVLLVVHILAPPLGV